MKRGIDNSYVISVLRPPGSTPYVSCGSQCQNDIKMSLRKYDRLWTGSTSRRLVMTPCTLVGSCKWLQKI